MSETSGSNTILIVEDEKVLLSALTILFKDQGFQVAAAGSIVELMDKLRDRKTSFKVAIVDYHLSDGNGSDAIKQILAKDSRTMIVTFSGDSADESFREALASGALVFLSKDTQPPRLIETIKRMIREYDTRYSSNAVHGKINVAEIGVTGVSKHLQEVASAVKKFANSDMPVLIRGENGTGKDLMASALHKLSNRNAKPFVAINCASIAPELIASELFGHKKGSFTGALIDKIGKFEAANGGTLFLDEIGDMPTEMQANLLRALQNSEITRVGENEPRKINVRVVAATNRNLEEAVKSGRFRMDLFYRLNALPLRLLPLRDRVEDIEPLVGKILSDWNAQHGSNRSVHTEVIEDLKSLKWPGNVRQLKHFVSLMLVLSDAQILTRKDLAQISDFDNSDSASENIVSESLLDYQVWLAQAQESEIAIIKKAFEKTKGNQSEAAQVLGISRSHLRSRMRVLKLEDL